MSSRGIPEVLMQKVDDYVDSLAPQIQPRIASELEIFQQKTIDSLETQVVDAFRSLFNKDKPSSSDGSRSGPWNLNDAAPDAYGGQSLPFADEIAKLTRSFGQISDDAGGDLREIFNLTEGSRGGNEQNRSVEGGGGGDFSSGARGFLSSALNIVQEQLDERGSKGGQSFEIGGVLGIISSTIKDASQNPEEKARLISPEIKQTVGDKLRSQHASIAEQFTRIALDHIKRWLRGNTSTRDLGDGAKAEIAEQVGDLVKGLGSLFGNKKSGHEESSRGIEDGNREGEGSGGGFSRVISDKLSTGLAKVHREVRLEFRKVLGEIEKQLFELLPDQFQRPLEKILGGNPFDSQLDRDASGPADRGFGDDIKAKLLGKIRDLVRKVQETLRESILGVVNGGHRKFERESWVFVQAMVEQKVQRYLPDVKINVPDDIGNENVSVGDPTSGSQHMGGGQSQQQQQQHMPSTTQGDYRPPPPRDTYQGESRPQQGYDEPPRYQNNQQYQSQEYRPEQQGYPPQQYPPPQDYNRQDQYAPPPQSYHQQAPPEYRSEQYPPSQQRYQQHGSAQSGYPPRESREGEYRRQDY
ncbi:C6 zinc finger domain containing [Pyrenophora seminiperda CCB06]|uniref:C6 zinc finger domain containing n=1 Tax=Pyrenophora seminiperda CCB06 TaxID=1302712 RepID=A0A3M7LZZ5_9PLEO|nr:C6 zinc finger domain containing [Pyrenophora seminiperda CCB06]